MSVQVARSAIIHPNVVLGENVIVEDYCILGTPFAGYAGESTLIGDNAVIRSQTVIYAGNRIGRDFQTGNKTNIRELNQIGDRVSVGTMSVVEHHVMIHDDVRIHTQVFIPEFSVLEHGVWIGPNVVLTNAKYPRMPDTKDRLQGPVVQRDARIGANATLLPGVVIGAYALIGAGSVVTRDVLSGVTVAGNPARMIGRSPYSELSNDTIP